MAKLVVLIITNTDRGLEIAEAWQEKGGASGVTIIDSHGVGSLKKLSNKPELPLFVSIAGVLNKIRESNQMMFSVVEDEQVAGLKAIVDDIIGGLLTPDTGIMFVLPVEQVMGTAFKPDPPAS